MRLCPRHLHRVIICTGVVKRSERMLNSFESFLEVAWGFARGCLVGAQKMPREIDVGREYLEKMEDCLDVAKDTLYESPNCAQIAKYCKQLSWRCLEDTW